MTNIDIRHGDCLAVLRELPAGSVDSVVTSPPYAMQRKSTYGGIPEKDYPEYIDMSNRRLSAELGKAPTDTEKKD